MIIRVWDEEAGRSLIFSKESHLKKHMKKSMDADDH